MHASTSLGDSVKGSRGFTLIELMVVAAIIALLAAIAIPSYLNQTRKSRRNAAEATLQQIALLEDRYRADNAGYLTANTAATWGTLGMADPTGTYYAYAVTATAASGTTPAYYSATATAKGDQLKDKAQGTSCTPLTYQMVYDSTNKVLNASTGPAAVCWNK
jgi:type IV pilus assembly protein PilE